MIRRVAAPTIIDDLLTKNPFSRPAEALDTVLAVIYLWTANPGASAKANRDYFESLKNQKQPGAKATYASSHFIIDQDGSIIRCIPESEEAWHVGSSQADPASGKIYTDWARGHFGTCAESPSTTSPNACTLGIEMCPVNVSGDFTERTLLATADLGAFLVSSYGLDPIADIATHHMVVGWKDCPRLWTVHPDLLEAFRRTVASRVAA